MRYTQSSELFNSFWMPYYNTEEGLTQVTAWMTANMQAYPSYHDGTFCCRLVPLKISSLISELLGMAAGCPSVPWSAFEVIACGLEISLKLRATNTSTFGALRRGSDIFAHSSLLTGFGHNQDVDPAAYGTKHSRPGNAYLITAQFENASTLGFTAFVAPGKPA